MYLEWVQRMENQVIPDPVSHASVPDRVSEGELCAHLTSYSPLSVLVLENLWLKGFEEKHKQKV